MSYLKKLILVILLLETMALAQGADITLSWDMPVTFEDGKPLLMCQEYGEPEWACLDLYTIYYGRTSGVLDEEPIIVLDERLLEVPLTLNEEGQWYFAITSSTNTQLESQLSDEVSIWIEEDDTKSKPDNGRILNIACDMSNGITSYNPCVQL